MSKKATTEPAQAEHPEAADQVAEQQAQAEHPEAIEVRELLRRNGLPRAWILPGGHLCFDAKHARIVAGQGFDALPTIAAE